MHFTFIYSDQGQFFTQQFLSLDFNFSVLPFPGYRDEDKGACKGFGYAIACDWQELGLVPCSVLSSPNFLENCSCGPGECSKQN